MKIEITGLLAAVAILGCGPKSPPPVEKPPPADNLAEKMDGHFAAIVKIRKAVTGGELDEARKQAIAFTSRLRNADHPDGWDPYLQRIRKTLFALVNTTDLETVAVLTAKAGRSCGSCHAALGIEALGAGSTPPVERPADLSEYMWLHLWASESMWNGLVGPSDAAWKEGASALAKAGLFPESDDVQLDEAMKAEATALNALGKQAASAGDEERVEIYGKFLGACANCHRQFREQVD